MLPKYARKIDKVGIELEGCWIGHRPAGWKPDGSVGPGDDDGDEDEDSDESDRCTNPHCSVCGGPRRNGASVRHWGEVASPPLPPRSAITWILENYPAKVNSTCGLHVHVSTRTVGGYSKLMDQASIATIIRQLERWGNRARVRRSGEFWKRLRGENSFCGRILGDIGHPEKQARQTSKGGERYRALNYCYQLHGTVELRVLPAFKSVRYACSAVRWYLGTVERLLRSVPETIAEYDALADVAPFAPETLPTVCFDNLEPETLKFPPLVIDETPETLRSSAPTLE